MTKKRTTRDNLWDVYLNWLLDKVDFNRKKYYKMLSQLHNIPFEVSRSAPMDENRLGDGLYLREYFFRDIGLREAEFDQLHKECSVLEMLVAFACRVSDEHLGFDEYGSMHSDRVMYMFLVNLGLDLYTDTYFRKVGSRKFYDEIESIIGRFAMREYGDDGIGSLFPLNRPYSGYKKMEIFRQMNVFFSRNCVNSIEDLDDVPK